MFKSLKIGNRMFAVLLWVVILFGVILYANSVIVQNKNINQSTQPILMIVFYAVIVLSIFPSVLIFRLTRDSEEVVKPGLEKGAAKRIVELENEKDSLAKKVTERTNELIALTAHQEEEIQKRTFELREKLLELEKFNKLAIGRELKMIELKEEIKKLNLKK